MAARLAVQREDVDSRRFLRLTAFVSGKVKAGYTHHITKESPETMFKDFKYTLTRVDQAGTSGKAEHILPRFQTEGDAPLALVFGYAGARARHLDKYAAIYRRAGCHTFSYILPTRFIFSCTEDVPHLAKRILDILDSEDLLKRPIFFHNLSDTGLMVYQGIDKVAREEGVKLDVRGHVMDSCPGPRPEITVGRCIAVPAVNYICSRRDGMGRREALREAYTFFLVKLVPNLVRRVRGIPSDLSLMDDTWVGHFARAERRPHPELFLYSRRDFYTPRAYMEETLAQRRSDGKANVRAVCWDKSWHVSHLPKYPREYEAAVHDFLFDAYFNDRTGENRRL